MKKILLTTVIAVAAAFMAANASAQSFHVNVIVAKQKQAFYYYPNANVYFNPASRQYIYARNGVWFTVNTLPFRFDFNMQRFTVYHNGANVWADNRSHVIAYRQNGFRQPAVAYYKYNNSRNNYGWNDGRR